ncbi:MAG: hypothetical protein GY771_07545, partial [bacterium]|nr:hypothetical protein [bacterium]
MTPIGEVTVIGGVKFKCIGAISNTLDKVVVPSGNAAD